MVEANTLAYCEKATITAVKSFIVQAQTCFDNIFENLFSNDAFENTIIKVAKTVTFTAVHTLHIKYTRALRFIYT